MTLKIQLATSRSSTTETADPLETLKLMEAHLDELAWRGIIPYAKLRQAKMLVRTRYQLPDPARAHPSQREGEYFD